MKNLRVIKTIPFLLGAVLVTADYATAQDIYRYGRSGNWTLVTDGASDGWGLNPNNPNNVGNPAGPGLPGAADEARINFGGNTVTIDSAVPNIDRLLIGVDESGTLEMNSGGSLSVGQDVRVGNNGFVDGRLDVNSGATLDVGRILWVGGQSLAFGFLDINAGGTVNVASHLWWGSYGGSEGTVNISGTLNQTGGILGLGTINALDPSGGTATVNILSGGSLNLNNIDAGSNPDTTPRLGSIQPGSVIDLQGGQLTVPNNFTTVIQNYIDAGRIVGNGVAGAVDINVIDGPIGGDFNADGTVDAADYTVWRDNLGGSSAVLNGNGSGAGTVVQADYDLWETNFGEAAPQTTVVTAAVPAALASAVPEPTSATLVALMACIGAVTRPRRLNTAC